MGLTAFVSIMLLVAFYGKILLSPNDFLFYSHGDGLKNYYTVGYYAMYDGDFQVTGTHYPYGELNIYTDNQPIISHILYLVNAYFIDISDHIVGILNYLMLLSILLTSLFVFKILKHLNSEDIFAMVFSILIAFLSPQILRFEGHYSLSYAAFIPWVMFLMIKILDTRRNISAWAIALFASLLFQSFVHTYYLFIHICFGGAVLFVLFFSNFPNKWKRWLSICWPLVATTMLFLVYNMTYDTVPDRPASPWGISHYVVKWQGTFLPNHGFFADLFRSIYGDYNVQFESQGHIGVIASLLLACSIIYYFRRRWNVQKSLLTFFIASVGVWIFGTNWLNEITNYALYDIFPKFRQFRGLGRLSWVFYYATTILIAIFISRVWAPKKRVQLILIIFAIGIWLIEVFSYNATSASRLHPNNHRLDKDKNQIVEHLNSIGIDTTKYQSILLLPYYFVGNEKFAMQRQINGMWDAMGVSYLTGIPLINHLGSRTSVKQSMTQFQLFKDSIILKQVVPDLNEKDILLMVDKSNINHGEGFLLHSSAHLSSFGIFDFYALPVKKLDEANQAILAHYHQITDSLIQHRGLHILPIDSVAIISHETYDEESIGPPLFGNGGMRFLKGEHIPFYIGSGRKNVKIRLWLHVDHEVMGMPNIIVKWVREDNSLISMAQLNYQEDPYIFNDWLMLDIDIPHDEEIRKCLFYSDNMDIEVDHLLIYESGVETYQVVDDSILLQNNVPVHIVN